MKRSMDDSLMLASFPGTRKRRRSSDGPEMRLLIPSKSAGAIIGKGGENIKRLRSQYSASVSIPDSVTPERVVNLSCSDLTKLCDCLGEILPSLEDGKVSQGQFDLRMLVHQSQAGAIIGRAGFKIKELRESSGASIRVYSECAPYSTERVIQIVGPKDNVVSAVRSIMQIREETPIKGQERLYDANSFDETFPYDYGGHGDKTKRVRQSPAPFPTDSFKYLAQPLAPNPWLPDDKSNRMIEMMSEIQVTIPNELCGTIIGKGGERINRIRGESGAQIRVDPPVANSDQRIITIGGNPGQIKIGQFLLQQCVRASAAGRRYLQQQQVQQGQPSAAGFPY